MPKPTTKFYIYFLWTNVPRQNTTQCMKMKKNKQMLLCMHFSLWHPKSHKNQVGRRNRHDGIATFSADSESFKLHLSCKGFNCVWARVWLQRNLWWMPPWIVKVKQEVIMVFRTLTCTNLFSFLLEFFHLICLLCTFPSHIITNSQIILVLP